MFRKVKNLMRFQSFSLMQLVETKRSISIKHELFKTQEKYSEIITLRGACEKPVPPKNCLIE